MNAGDDEYQVVLDNVGYNLGSVITDGLFTDLSTINSLKLDKSCWNQNLVSSLSIGDRVYII